jgi:hypothetical protein
MSRRSLIESRSALQQSQLQELRELQELYSIIQTLRNKIAHITTIT